MSAVYNVPGATPVLVGPNTGGSLSTLGYTRNGSQVQFTKFLEKIPVDLNGGDSGPPGDIQIMGEMAVIRLLLTKYDETVAATLYPSTAGGTAGTIATPGTLLFSGGSGGSSLGWRVLLNSPVLPYNFLTCIMEEPHEQNRGTKFCEWSVVFTAYATAANSGVLWNRATS